MFTLELNGIELPKHAQEEISQALNQTLMAKLGSLNLSKNKGNLITNILLPNGGKLECILSPALKGQLETLHNSLEKKEVIGYELKQLL